MTIIIKVDSDNDIYEMTVNGEVYTLDNVYDSEYGKLFDELNMSIEVLQTQRCSIVLVNVKYQLNKTYTFHKLNLIRIDNINVNKININ